MYNPNHKFNKLIPFIPGHIVISSIFQRNFLLHTHTRLICYLFIYLTQLFAIDFAL